MIKFYILSKSLSLKPEELFNARVVLITENEGGITVHFL